MVNKKEMFYKSLEVSHMLVAQKLRFGDAAIDATMGNGHDTLFLARCVGEGGRVYAFDIQGRAIAQTQTLLKKHQCEAQVSLICGSHHQMDQHVECRVNAVMFNLGFLPGSENKKIVTRSKTTIEAIDKALMLLDVGGLLVVVIYPGHEEGALEKEEVLCFVSQLPQEQYNGFCFDLINQINKPPVLVGIEKKF